MLDVEARCDVWVGGMGHLEAGIQMLGLGSRKQCEYKVILKGKNMRMIKLGGWTKHRLNESFGERMKVEIMRSWWRSSRQNQREGTETGEMLRGCTSSGFHVSAGELHSCDPD